jgi:microcystin-dependent protein
MTTPFLGQVEIFAFDFPPRGWTTCSGQLLPISQYRALFALLGTTYGGDGSTTFGLPDLRGRIPIGSGQGRGLSNYNRGQKGGEETHALSINEMQQHDHSFYVDATTPATSNTDVPSTSVVLGRTIGKQSGVANPFDLFLYAPPGATVTATPLDPHTIGFTGGQGHPNLMPYLALNFCISLQGTSPSPN